MNKVRIMFYTLLIQIVSNKYLHPYMYMLVELFGKACKKLYHITHKNVITGN